MMHNVLSSNEISDILNDPFVNTTKANLSDAQKVVKFSFPLSDDMRHKLSNRLAMRLPPTVPMRWIKGDTPLHTDKGRKQFSKTHLIYLTDSVGKLIIDGQVHPIAAGDAHIFSEGVVHGTVGTGNTARLMMGPMSETGFGVGLAASSPLTTESRSFDQIVKGNISIKKLSSHRYRITFSKIGKFLMYQVWDKDSVNLNKKRKVGYVSAKTWVTAVKKYNKEVEDSDSDKPLYAPTTIMETEDDDIYAFVIHNACINSHGQVVFTVSTKEISPQNNTSKKLVQLPCGKCNNVRFDIDYLGTVNNTTNTTDINLEYYEFDEYDREYVFYKVKNTQTDKQILNKDLLNILKTNNISSYSYSIGLWYDVYTKSQLEIESSSIIVKQCVGEDCGLINSFRISLVGGEIVSVVKIKKGMFPPDVDPKEITSIKFGN